MKLFSNYKNDKSLLKSNFTKDERSSFSMCALACTILIFIPVVLLIINIYYLFLMRPYLCVTITFIFVFIASFIYLLFKKTIFKREKTVEGLNLNRILYTNLLFVSIVILILFAIAMLFIVPKFII